MTSTIAQHRPPLNVEEAAEYLNVSVRFVRDRRRDGQLPAIKLGGLLRFDPDDLDGTSNMCENFRTMRFESESPSPQ